MRTAEILTSKSELKVEEKGLWLGENYIKLCWEHPER